MRAPGRASHARGARIAALSLGVLAGCAVAPVRLDAPRTVSGLRIAPYATTEECVALEDGERIAYRFDAQPPVAFNIHFHDGTAVLIPLTQENATEGTGDFTADRRQVYCLTWEAGAQGSNVSYRVRPWPRQQ